MKDKKINFNKLEKYLNQFPGSYDISRTGEEEKLNLYFNVDNYKIYVKKYRISKIISLRYSCIAITDYSLSTIRIYDSFNWRANNTFLYKYLVGYLYNDNVLDLYNNAI